MDPFTDFLTTQAAQEQIRYDAKYADDLRLFNEGCTSYPERAQHQYDTNGTVLPPPTVPVKKTATVVDMQIVEGTWRDPNLHAPVFVPVKVPPQTGIAAVVPGAATLDSVMAALTQVASMLVLLNAKVDALTPKSKVSK